MWLDLKNIVLSEISQVQKISYCIMDISGDLESAGEFMVAESRSVVVRSGGRVDTNPTRGNFSGAWKTSSILT